jgi:hypothetical protein
MDALGAAAVIGSVSTLVVSLTGMVVAFRVVPSRGRPETEATDKQINVNLLPPGGPTPGPPVALETTNSGVSYGQIRQAIGAGHAAWLERLIERVRRWLTTRT